MSIIVVNSGFKNSAGFQWLTSGSRVAHAGPAAFLPIFIRYQLALKDMSTT